MYLNIPQRHICCQGIKYPRCIFFAVEVYSPEKGGEHVETYKHTLFGERVRRARMKLGWNQKHLAEVTGIPQGNISRIERVKIEDIHLSRFVILMRTLGVGADYLLGLKEQEEPFVKVGQEA